MSIKINIQVASRIASKTTNQEIVCYCNDYVAVFTFDEEWENYPCKVAVFTYNERGKNKKIEVAFTGNECSVPMLKNCDKVFIGVYAGTEENRISSTVVRVYCQKGAQNDATSTVVSEDAIQRLSAIAEKASLSTVISARLLNGNLMITRSDGVELNVGAVQDHCDENGNLISSSYVRVNDNILINGDFKINQRGANGTLSSGYFADHWKLTTVDNQSVEYDKDTNTFITSGKYCYVTQWIEDYSRIINKKYTLSICINNKIYKKTDCIKNLTTGTYGSISFPEGNMKPIFYAGKFSIEIVISANMTACIQWVKLEEGEACTAPYAIKRNYSEELSLCQRYYQKIEGLQRAVNINNGALKFALPLCVSMYKNPTLILAENSGIQSLNNTNIIGGFTITTEKINNNLLQIQASKVSHGLNDGVFYFKVESALDAEL